ncbi:glycosyl hydrolase, partial [Dysgonomonas mossii]
PEDTRNFTLLLQEFRRQLDAIDPSLRLTVAAPAPKDASSKLELPAIARTGDFINLMTYDMPNSLELRANFHAALLPSPRDPDRAEGLTVVETVERYLKAGVPASQLVLGIPLYSRGWTGLPAANDGLY